MDNLDSHLDYIENSHNFDSQNLTDEEVTGWGNVLFQQDISLDEKKKALGILAHVGNLNAYKSLKKYAEHPDTELETWATLALGECTMFLHDDMSGENEHYFVYTGVGPKNNLTRVYCMVLPRESKTFETYQHKIIENEVSYVARDLKCEIEWFDFKTNYSSFSILIPTYIAIATIIEKCIENCNHFGSFVLEEYYCETGVPDEKEIEEIINIVRKS
jgi:hypothetical protein